MIVVDSGRTSSWNKEKRGKERENVSSALVSLHHPASACVYDGWRKNSIFAIIHLPSSFRPSCLLSSFLLCQELLPVSSSFSPRKHVARVHVRCTAPAGHRERQLWVTARTGEKTSHQQVTRTGLRFNSTKRSLPLSFSTCIAHPTLSSLSPDSAAPISTQRATSGTSTAVTSKAKTASQIVRPRTIARTTTTTKRPTASASSTRAAGAGAKRGPAASKVCSRLNGQFWGR